jgi:hypothetical protein
MISSSPGLQSKGMPLRAIVTRQINTIGLGRSMRKRVAAPCRTWDELFPKSDTSKLNRHARRDENFDFVRSQNSQLVLEYGLETTHRLHRLVEGIAAASLRLTRSLILASDFLLKSPRQGLLRELGQALKGRQNLLIICRSIRLAWRGGNNPKKACVLHSSGCWSRRSLRSAPNQSIEVAGCLIGSGMPAGLSSIWKRFMDLLSADLRMEVESSK